VAPDLCLYTRHFQIAPDAIELAESLLGRHDPNRNPSPRVASHEFLTLRTCSDRASIKSHFPLDTVADQTFWPVAIFSSSAILSSIGGWVS
jgi:hypothetical protein